MYGADGESSVTRIADTIERDRLLALGCTLDGYISRDDADAALEEAMLEGIMPHMYWFVVVPTSTGTAPVELLCTVTPDPPSRPDCDVFAFGDDSEMARAQFADHGGVYGANSCAAGTRKSDIAKGEIIKPSVTDELYY